MGATAEEGECTLVSYLFATWTGFQIWNTQPYMHLVQTWQVTSKGVLKVHFAILGPEGDFGTYEDLLDDPGSHVPVSRSWNYSLESGIRVAAFII